MGVPHETQRDRMDESLGVIIRLLTKTEPITYKSDWFALKEATVYLRSFRQPYMQVAVAWVQRPVGGGFGG